jgi:hypothetical protein
VFLYDFESIKNQNPIMLKKIYFPRSIANGEKIQTISLIDDLFYCGHGKEYPQVSAINFDGVVVKNHAFDKTSLLNMIKKQHPDVTLINYSYENEGMCFYEENGKVYPVLGHCIAEMGRTYITKIGKPEWEPVETRVYTQNVYGALEWNRPTFINGASDYGDDVRVEYAKDDNGNVHLRGCATYTRTHSDGNIAQVMNLDLFQLPYPYAPYRNQFYTTPASGGANRSNRISVTKDGFVKLESVYDQGGTAKPFCVLDGISFHVDTRPV